MKAQLLGAIAAVATTVPRRMVKVRPPVGTTWFSHNGEMFSELNDDGTMNAPIEAVDALCDGPAGFAFVGHIESAPPTAAAVTVDDSESAPAIDNQAAADGPSPSLSRLLRRCSLGSLFQTFQSPHTAWQVGVDRAGRFTLGRPRRCIFRFPHALPSRWG